MWCLSRYYVNQKPVVNVTLSLPEEVVRRLRKTAKERYGGRKGALSGLVKEALEEHLGSLEAERPVSRFKAFKGEREVAEGGSLEELATRLGQLNVDPRAVRIISTTPLKPVIRVGLRGKSN
jgi:hypothetical protein